MTLKRTITDIIDKIAHRESGAGRPQMRAQHQGLQRQRHQRQGQDGADNEPLGRPPHPAAIVVRVISFTSGLRTWLAGAESYCY